MNRQKTWEEINSLDDTISDNERKMISTLEKNAKTRCPYLQKDGNFFHYCEVKYPDLIEKNQEERELIYSPGLKNSSRLISSII